MSLPFFNVVSVLSCNCLDWVSNLSLNLFFPCWSLFVFKDYISFSNGIFSHQYKTWFAFLSIMPFHLMYNKLLPDKLALLNGGWTLLSLSPTLSEAASCSSLLDVTAHPLFFYLSVGRGKGYPHSTPGESLVLSLFKDLASPTSFEDLMAILGFTSPGLLS